MYEPMEVARSLQVNALISVIDAVRPKAFCFSGEIHDFWELVFVKEGYATATGEERVFRLSPGQLLFHKPMEFHKIRSEGDSSPHLIILSFSAYGRGMDFFREKCFFLDSNLASEYESCAEKCSRAIAAFNNGNAEYSALSERSAVCVEHFLLNLIDSGEKGDLQSPTEDEIRYRTAVSVMNSHCSENLSVEEIAELCGLSASTLKRSFARFSDKGIASVFRTLKIRRAMELLSDGASAVEVAEKVGFAEPAYFHSVFKRETGMTPLDYKKSKTGKRT